jgi:uncharacterized membrane protein
MKSYLFSPGRLEAFSDGVLAIILTIMVLELHAPDGSTLSSLHHLVPTFLIYLLSFIYIAIYWNNHHHLFKAAKGVNSGIMWANMILLFFLSLTPFAAAWMGKFPSEGTPIAFYALIQLCAAISYFSLQGAIVKTLGTESTFAQSVGKDFKGKLSLVGYILAVLFAYSTPLISQILFVLVALMWFIPDARAAHAASNERE